jgi:glycosyltransferase involved in cell wall biosynthesis
MIIQGFITPSTSYGLVTLGLIQELQLMGEKVTIHPYNQNPEINGFVIQPNEKFYDYNAPCLMIDHQYRMQSSLGKGKRVGYTFFEMDSLTEFEVHQLNSLHALVVASFWAKEVAKKSGVEIPIHVVPLAFNPDIFKPENTTRKDKCVFLSIGKWEVRKDQDGIVEAFSKAFTNEPVELCLSMDNPFLDQQFLEVKKLNYRHKLKDKLTIIPRLPEQRQVARLINDSCCFVSHSKAEGACLPIIESLACGKFVISPKFSGETEFVKNGCLITEHDGIEPASDGKWFGVNADINQGNWCKPSEESLIENLRCVYEKWKSGVFENADGLDHAKNFTVRHQAERIINVSKIV